MLSAKPKNRFDGIDAGFRVAVQGLGKSGVCRPALIAKSDVVSSNRVHGQAPILKERCTADLAGNHFDQKGNRTNLQVPYSYSIIVVFYNNWTARTRNGSEVRVLRFALVGRSLERPGLRR
jgi:hypothetical protein